MKLKLDRIISLATLVASLIAIFLVLRKPAPVAQGPALVTPSTASVPAAAQASPASQQVPASVSSMPTQAASPAATAPAASAAANAKAGANGSSDAITAMLAKTLGAGTGALTPDSNVGGGEPVIKDQQVTMDGDVVHGKFLTEIAGKDVWVTISGHMGEKDGYATFDPTEFKVGDMEVPVSLVNPALQRKLAEERDRLKVPDGSQ
jgi:hypothetical protein